MDQPLIPEEDKRAEEEEDDKNTAAGGAEGGGGGRKRWSVLRVATFESSPPSSAGDSSPPTSPSLAMGELLFDEEEGGDGPGQRKRAKRKRKRKKEFEPSEASVLVAATYVEDGLHGRLIGYALEGRALDLYRLYHSEWWRSLYLVFVTAHIALAFVEKPAPSSRVEPRDVVFAALGALCAAVYAADLYLILASFGWKRSGRWTHARVLVLALIAADLAAAAASGLSVVRFSRPVRPLMLVCRFRNVRRVFAGFLAVVPQLLGTLTFLLLMTVTFGLAGYLFFWDVPGSRFHSVHGSMYAMVLGANAFGTLPQTLEPLYAYSQWSGLFMAAFIVVVALFGLKMVVAVAYSRYKAFLSSREARVDQKRRVALAAAFRLASGAKACHDEGVGVSRDTWLRMRSHLRGRHRLLPPTTRRDTSDAAGCGLGRSLFDAVDADGRGWVDYRGFLELCALLDFRPPPRTPVSRHECVNRARRSVRNAYYTYVLVGGAELPLCELVLSVLVVANVVQGMVLASPHASTGWRAVNVVLLSVFWCDCALKVFGFGWRRYWSRAIPRVDLACNVIGTVFVLTDWTSDPSRSHPAVYSVAMFFRLVRLAKLADLAQASKKIVRTASRVLAVLLRLLLVLFCLLYFFASLGVEFYSGSLRPGNPALARGHASWLAASSVLGFEQFHSAMLTLLQIAIQGSWPEVMDAAVAVTGPASYYFFFIYRLTAAFVFLPVFQGWVIESFITHYTAVCKEVDAEGEERAQQRRAVREHEHAAASGTLLLAGGATAAGAGAAGGKGGSEYGATEETASSASASTAASSSRALQPPMPKTPLVQIVRSSSRLYSPAERPGAAGGGAGPAGAFAAPALPPPRGDVAWTRKQAALLAEAVAPSEISSSASLNGPDAELAELRSELDHRNRQLATLTARLASTGEELERLRRRDARRSGNSAV